MKIHFSVFLLTAREGLVEGRIKDVNHQLLFDTGTKEEAEAALKKAHIFDPKEKLSGPNWLINSGFRFVILEVFEAS
ncbi:MAG TPA: hypothetical protein PKM27_16010 [Saprospiraceae bacterium]|nr:hypothetical protein [Saprospiraceae bacterium]HNT19903.1 hypothetical protein [Saprospiraceae bacterium]